MAHTYFASNMSIQLKLYSENMLHLLNATTRGTAFLIINQVQYRVCIEGYTEWDLLFLHTEAPPTTDN